MQTNVLQCLVLLLITILKYSKNVSQTSLLCDAFCLQDYLDLTNIPESHYLDPDSTEEGAHPNTQHAGDTDMQEKHSVVL